MKKGFTLIELLAVIVILAIIASIATPIVLNIISDAKMSSSDRSVDNYVDAVELAITNYQIKNSLNPTTFLITDNGKKISNGSITIPIEYSGTSLTSGAFVLDDKNNVTLKNGSIEGIDKVYSTSKGKTTTLTKNNGIYESDGGRYIYKGEDPDNYIWLDENGDSIKTDEELYRIISYEPDGTIKVIRDNRILNPNPHKDEGPYAFSWDTRDTTIGTRQNTANSYCNYGSNSDEYYGCNAWGKMDNTTTDKVLLGKINNFYYKYYINNTATELSQNATNLTVTNNSTLNNYLNKDWLNANSNLNNYIEEHSFNVGGPMYHSTYTGGDQGLEREKYQELINTWNGKVGLMNITEYVEASLDNACTDVYNSYCVNPKYYYDKNGDGTKTQNNTTNDWPCKIKNYLYKSGYPQWTLSANSGYHNLVWFIFSPGDLTNSYPYYGLGVRPAFYLKSSLSLNGTGTKLDPYKISK